MKKSINVRKLAESPVVGNASPFTTGDADELLELLEVVTGIGAELAGPAVQWQSIEAARVTFENAPAWQMRLAEGEGSWCFLWLPTDNVLVWYE